ncbi:MAG: radical SAM protein [Candidatus Riflebacteria bacterium]|nr:radical SAM protein [Candidatus Riflebacteria bacterium]
MQDLFLDDRIFPTAIRIDASTVCQLKCPLCPRTTGETSKTLGNGFLKFDDFRNLVDANPQIKMIEFGNFGEVFLNPEFSEILRYASENSIETSIDEGANLNDASNEVLEALIKYQTKVVRCAIDGASQSSYEKYRVGGRLVDVINNIKKINSFKEKYSSDKPDLIFQFVLFDHNKHELEYARLLSKMLKMSFYIKLNFNSRTMQPSDKEIVRKYAGFSDRKEYLQKTGRHYQRVLCYDMWMSPQVNWDGRLIGCTRNIWGDYSVNVFRDGLQNSLNSEKILHNRRILMGKTPSTEDIPCLNCGNFKNMKNTGDWISTDEISEYIVNSSSGMLGNHSEKSH